MQRVTIDGKLMELKCETKTDGDRTVYRFYYAEVKDNLEAEITPNKEDCDSEDSNQ